MLPSQGEFSPPGNAWQHLADFSGCQNWGERELLACSGQGPRVLLNIQQSQDRPHDKEWPDPRGQ